MRKVGVRSSQDRPNKAPGGTERDSAEKSNKSVRPQVQRSDGKRSATGEPRGYVPYTPGPDRETLETRYGIDVPAGHARRLQRLESEFGRDLVRRWADEGMTVETMAKPRDMQAFRERQSGQPEAVSRNNEPRHEGSLPHNVASNRNDPPAGRTQVPVIPRPAVSAPDQAVSEAIQREDNQLTVSRPGTAMRVHPRLKVSSPNDPAEREAERIAEKVMRMAPIEDGAGLGLTHGVYGKAPAGGSVVQGEAMERIKSLKGGGKPLSPSARSFFEPRFARDFGDVRVHTGREADSLTREVHARAFTTGRDVFFRKGEYAPGSSEGRRLLAHELTHVVQQQSVPAADGPTRVNSPADPGKGEEVTGRQALVADLDGLSRQAHDWERPYGEPVDSDLESLLQRQGDETATEEPENDGAADTRPWTVPFDGGTAQTYAEAIDGLDHIYSFIFFNTPSSGTLPEVWEEQLDGVQEACRDALPTLEGKYGLLDPHDTSMLELVGGMAATRWDMAVEATRKQVSPELEKLRSDHDLTSTIKELQERLHFAFTEGADEEHIKAIQDTLTAVQEYKKEIDKVIGWAKDAADLLESAEALEFFNKLDDISRRFGTVLDYAQKATDAAKIIYNVATDKGASGNFKALNDFENGLDAIDLGMGFAKNVPVLGALWKHYYGPMARECLRMLRHIAKLVDKQRRQEASVLMDAFTQERVIGGAPKIPDGYDSYFPGGQAVFSYMWHVCNSGKRQRLAHATTTVASYFVDHADQFNAGVPGSGVKLDTESTAKWYDPGSWGDEEAVNLDQFVTANKDMIWAMLYGAIIPQDILA